MDEHVPRAVTEALRLRQVDILTAQADGRTGIDDSRLLDRANDLGRVVFSQDSDLLSEAARRQERGIPFEGVVYAHQMRATIGQIVQDLELIGKAARPDELRNRVEYLPLK